MRIRPALLAPMVVAAFFAVVLAGRAWELPTMTHEFSDSGVEGKKVEMIVEGLRCRGTSNFFVQRLQEVPGLLAVGTYVQEHRAEITYDPDSITVEQIREIIEEPIFTRDGNFAFPFSVKEVVE